MRLAAMCTRNSGGGKAKSAGIRFLQYHRGRREPQRKAGGGKNEENDSLMKNPC
jgi:hypothetical protein